MLDKRSTVAIADIYVRDYPLATRSQEHASTVTHLNAREAAVHPHHCPGCSVPAQLDSIVPADNAKVGVSQQQTSALLFSLTCILLASFAGCYPASIDAVEY